MKKVEISVEKLILPTYEEPKSEDLPMFAENRVHQRTSGNPYPNKIVARVNRTSRVDKEYTAVRLENEFVRVVILPEIGGRIYSATDKTTGYDFFYKQHVIKPALIGVLGSWISGGVEFNWPFHHRASGFMPCDFKMEEYPAKLYVLDTKTETSSEKFLLAEHEGVTGDIDGWQLKVKQSIDMAARMPESDEFREMHHVGAVPAVKVEARNVTTGERYEGWVSCGLHIFEPAYLWLGDRYAVAMPRREAKRYLSRLEIMDSEGESWRENIEVNKPARIGSWQIYQVGYDTQRGRWSTSSVVECVRDGWWSVVRVALWLILAASLVMFLTAGGRSLAEKKNKEAKR